MEDNQAAVAAHRAEACDRLSPVGRKLFKFVEYDADENLVAEIRKHPIGIVVTAAIGIFISIAIVAASILLTRLLDNSNLGFNNTDTIKTIIIVAGVIIGLLGLGVTAISIVLYTRNVIFITNEKIAEVSYISLFNRKVTQLSLGQVEDVTVQQVGIFSHFFDYGTIVIETAGEKENCNFTLVPTPNHFSQVIIEGHEQIIHKYGN